MPSFESFSPGLRGIWGRPFIELPELVSDTLLSEIHAEVCVALSKLPANYTGGSHRSMGIMPKEREGEAHVDYQEVIRELPDAEFETFRGLAAEPDSFSIADRDSGLFGEERKFPLSKAQMVWLKVRYHVYFPWKTYVELMPNDRWEDKSSPKTFGRLARAFFPRTIEWALSLPFVHIGRCNIMGLEAFDHGTVHRDGDPNEQVEPDHFVTIVPGADKRLFLYDAVQRQERFVAGKSYWFNDHDYHGVAADPHFRYSIRVDGVFRDDFRARIKGE